jgi:hypothetical protein
LFSVSELLYLLFLLFCLTYMSRETLLPANVRRSDLPCKAFDAKRRRLIRPACFDAAACVVPHDQGERVEDMRVVNMNALRRRPTRAGTAAL